MGPFKFVGNKDGRIPTKRLTIFKQYCFEPRKQMPDQNSDQREADNWVQLGLFKGKCQISETMYIVAFHQLKQIYLILKRKHRPL